MIDIINNNYRMAFRLILIIYIHYFLAKLYRFQQT